MVISKTRVTEMPITVYTIVWAAIGLLSLVGLYLFNTKPSFLAFITKREYLVAILISSLLGMREHNIMASTILAVVFVIMLKQYPLYIKNCALNKKNLQQKHPNYPQHHQQQR